MTAMTSCIWTIFEIAIVVGSYLDNDDGHKLLSLAVLCFPISLSVYGIHQVIWLEEMFSIGNAQTMVYFCYVVVSVSTDFE